MDKAMPALGDAAEACQGTRRQLRRKESQVSSTPNMVMEIFYIRNRTGGPPGSRDP